MTKLNLYEVYFPDGSGLTTKYHDGGGIALLAESKDLAIARIKDAFPKLSWEGTQVIEHRPDALLVFPDSGCC